MNKPSILVTGSNGQLGLTFRDIAISYPAYNFHFVSKADLSITEKSAVDNIFETIRPQYCINCAAYTAVDLAQTNKEIAFEVNATASGYLSEAAKTKGTRFIHISTDYVFDGESELPYTEADPINPTNVYGESKAAGEAIVLNNNDEAIIIRTSWVYSKHGKNFVKTMARLMNEKSEISVVSDQRGAPTYTNDLAAAIMTIIGKEAQIPGIFHYSNRGNISWFEFAVAIRDLLNSSCKVNPIPSASYPTPAKRPSFSLLNTSKIVSLYGVSVPDWKASLEKCIESLSK